MYLGFEQGTLTFASMPHDYGNLMYLGFREPVTFACMTPMGIPLCT